MSIPAWSARHALSVALLMAAACVAGLVSITAMPVELLPRIVLPTLSVYSSMPGASALVVRRTITMPAEKAAASVPGVRDVDSRVADGVSLTTLRFAWGTDMDAAALNLREQLDGSPPAPEGAAGPIVLRADRDAAPLGVLVATTDGDELVGAQLLRDVVQRRVEEIDGIASAEVIGLPQREILVKLNPDAARSAGVTAEDVGRTITAETRSSAAGTVVDAGDEVPVRVTGDVTSPTLLGAVSVRAAHGERQVRLGAVASVTDTSVEGPIAVRDGGGRSAAFIVRRTPSSNSLVVAARLDQVVRELSTRHRELHLRFQAEDAEFLSAALGTLVQELALGGALALVALLMFLRDRPLALTAVLTLPVTALGAAAILRFLGATANLITLAGAVLGVALLMDNSVVVAEAIQRRLDDGEPPVRAAVRGAEEVQVPLLVGTMTTAAVFAPLVFIGGFGGALFGELALTVAVVLGLSVLVAISVPVAVAVWGERRHALRRESPAATRVPTAADRALGAALGWYERRLDLVLAGRWQAIGIACVVVLGGVAALWSSEVALLPTLRESSFTLQLTASEGASAERASQLTEQVGQRLAADPDVRSVLSLAGVRPIAPHHATLVEVPSAALLHVEARDAASAAMVRTKALLVASQAGARLASVSDNADLGFADVLGAEGAAVRVEVSDDDPVRRDAYSERLSARLRSRLGSGARVDVTTSRRRPTVAIEAKPMTADVFGTSAEGIADAVRIRSRGLHAADILEPTTSVPIRVFVNDAPPSLAELHGLDVGAGVPLGAVATVRTDSEPAVVIRHNFRDAAVIEVQPSGLSLAKVVETVEDAVKTEARPETVLARVTGQAYVAREAVHGMVFAFAGATLLCFLLLAIEFESLTVPLVVFASVPFGLAGGLIALRLAGGTLNVMSMLGLVVVAGLVDNDAVLKIDAVRRARAQGLPVREAIHEAGRTRFRPIVINSLTAMCGLIPAALGIGTGAELQAPLAITVIGGLVTSTVLTLFVVPVLYTFVDHDTPTVAAVPAKLCA